MAKMIRVSLIGGSGRMGQAISRAAEAAQDMEIESRLSRGDDIGRAIGGADAVVDVSHADAVEQVCTACVERRKPLVIGTTGHTVAQLDAVHAAAKTVPVILAPNFSIGVNAIVWLARKTAELLGERFDIEIIEAHHRMKKDAPSGTAKQLAEVLSAARGLRYEDDVAHGRHGSVGERPPKQIGMHAVRGGDIVGEHTVVFAGDGERLELTHRAASRDIFAAGALRAARWIVGRTAGFYTMQDVLGLAGEQ
jgi:4-hydroxy-tetrahydrodipicolinate reductase